MIRKCSFQVIVSQDIGIAYAICLVSQLLVVFDFSYCAAQCRQSVYRCSVLWKCALMLSGWAPCVTFESCGFLVNTLKCEKMCVYIYILPIAYWIAY